MKRWSKHIPWIAAGVAVLAIVSSMRPPKESGAFNIADFGRLPALMGGRIQPLDSVARNSLLQIRTRKTVRLEKSDVSPARTMAAREWLLELMMKPEVANERKIFRIDNLEVRDMMKVSHDDKYFSYQQLEPQLDHLDGEARSIGNIDEKVRTAFQKQVMHLFESVLLYNRLKTSVQPPGGDGLDEELASFHALLEPARQAVQAQQTGEPYDTNVLQHVLAHLNRFKFMAQMGTPLMVPPADPKEDPEKWVNVGTSLMSANVETPVEAYASMAGAYRKGDAATFNAAVEKYSGWLKEHGLTKQTKKAGAEFFFNRLEPFYQALIIYLVAFLAVCVYWFRFVPWLRVTAFALVVVALVVHTSGLIFRMALEGRPPVTNLYSSAIFIGWGAAILGLVLERFYKDGIGLMTSSVVGFVTLIIAHNLALGGDTMEMLRAVLDTNFWLATHVVTVTMGYASTFVAGFLGVLYIILGLFTPSLTSAKGKSLSRMVYGIVCFATLFSFIGTILGGIWADQSWGRFWGWDPKENGALLIVLWNAIYLHVRWGKLLPERGLMAMAVFGNIVTSFSWFGVNMLGVGLHSYGFMDKAFIWLILFDVSQLVIIAFAFARPELWRSFRAIPVIGERTEAPKPA